MNKIIIKDNFLNKTTFTSIRDTMFDAPGSVFPWFLQKDKVMEGDNEMQLTHLFYHKVPNSDFFKILFPILNKLQIRAIQRVKANCTFKKNKKRLYSYHIDEITPKNETAGKTSIFYLHTTNGPTFFKTGEKVDCIANRMVTFATNLKHTGSTHTDTLLRGVININWF